MGSNEPASADEAAFERAILESFTPQELAVEYTRYFREPPPAEFAPAELIERMLSLPSNRRDTGKL